MPSAALSIEDVLESLAATPRRIADMTAVLTPAQLRTSPKPDDWSANDVLAHLRACADMWGGSIETILREDHPTFRAVNPRTWITQTDYPDLEFDVSLRAFTKQRDDLLVALRALTNEGWSRSATVTGAGKVLERSVLFYGRWLAQHERPHLKQLRGIVDRLGTG